MVECGKFSVSILFLFIIFELYLFPAAQRNYGDQRNVFRSEESKEICSC